MQTLDAQMEDYIQQIVDVLEADGFFGDLSVTVPEFQQLARDMLIERSRILGSYQLDEDGIKELLSAAVQLEVNAKIGSFLDQGIISLGVNEMGQVTMIPNQEKIAARWK